MSGTSRDARGHGTSATPGDTSGGVGATFGALLILLRLRLTLLARGRSTGGGRSGRSSGNRLLLRAIVLAVVGVIFATSIGNLLSNVVSGSTGRLLLTPVLTLISTWATVLLFLFCVPTVLAAFTYSSDLRLLLLTPLSPRLLLGEKFILVYGGFALPVVVVGGIILIGVGQALGEGLGYDLVTFLTLLLLPIGPLAVAMLLTVLVLRWVPPARARNVTAVLGALIGISFYIGSQILGMRGGRSLGGLQVTIAQSAHAWWSSLPTTWLGQALAAAGQGDVATTVTYLLAAAALAFVLAGLAIVLSAHLFATGWASYQEIGRRPRPAQLAAAPADRPIIFGTAGGVVMAKAAGTRGRRSPPIWWPLVGKEWRTLVRDPSLWARLLYPLVAVIFGFYRTFTQTISSADLASGGSSSLAGAGWLFGTLAFMTYIVVAALSLPVINREGRALYLLALAPVSARDILLAKWTYCVLPILALVEGALLVSSLILHLPLGAALLAGLTLAALVVALSGAELLLSLIWPRLDWDNPRQQVSGTASLAGMLGGLVLVSATGALFLFTLAWSADQPVAAAATGLGIFVLSGLIIASVAVVAPRRLDGLLTR